MKRRGTKDWIGIVAFIVVIVLLVGFIGATLLVPPWRDAVVTTLFLLGLMMC